MLCLSCGIIVEGNCGEHWSLVILLMIDCRGNGLSLAFQERKTKMHLVHNLPQTNTTRNNRKKSRDTAKTYKPLQPMMHMAVDVPNLPDNRARLPFRLAET